MSDINECPTLALYSRNDDPMTQALRSERDIDLDQLVGLHRLASPATVAMSSGHTSTGIFSSKRPSTITKPTSSGTSYPLGGKTCNENIIATYESSLSATHGSGSENEREAVRDDALLGIGDWVADQPRESDTLRGTAKARKRNQPARRRQKHKKPVVIIQQERFDSASEEDNFPVAAQTSRHRAGTIYRISSGNGTDLHRGTKYLKHRREERAVHTLQLAEEGRIGVDNAISSSSAAAPITRTRRALIIVLIVVIVLTFLVCSFVGARTGKNHVQHTKVAIFTGTVLISCCTVFAMVLAGRGWHESLLAGVLESLFGFALLVEIGDFMET